jgi:hypothetical protein
LVLQGYWLVFFLLWSLRLFCWCFRLAYTVALAVASVGLRLSFRLSRWLLLRSLTFFNFVFSFTLRALLSWWHPN